MKNEGNGSPGESNPQASTARLGLKPSGQDHLAREEPSMSVLRIPQILYIGNDIDGLSLE